MIENVSEQVNKMMRNYFLESGGKIKGSIERQMENSMETVKNPSREASSPGRDTEGAKSPDDVRAAAGKVSEKLDEIGSPYDLTVDPDTNRVLIKVKNDTGGGEARQIPQKVILEMAKRLDDLTGAIIDSKS
ncbi:MAG: flagellar protein FlaG [Nitrospinota bacterium]|nr:flagellar protein FlaG [Nitrospinota bacterium]